MRPSVLLSVCITTVNTFVNGLIPSLHPHHQVMETLPFFLAPQLHHLAATVVTTNHSATASQEIQQRRFRRGRGKDPAVLEYALELPPASLVHVALPFETRSLFVCLMSACMLGTERKVCAHTKWHI